LAQYITESNQIDGQLRASIIENLKEALPTAAFKTSEEIITSVISEINMPLPKVKVAQFINPPISASPYVKKFTPANRTDTYKYTSTPNESFSVKQMNSLYSISPIKRDFEEIDAYNPAKSIQTPSKTKLGTDKIRQSFTVQQDASDYDMDDEDQYIDDAAGVFYDEPQLKSNHINQLTKNDVYQDMDYTSTFNSELKTNQKSQTSKRIEVDSGMSPASTDQNLKTRPKIHAMPTPKTQTQLFKRV